MKIRIVFLMSVVLMLALAVPAAAQEPKYGGTLVVGIGADIAKWDVHNCSGMIGLGIQRLVTETLTDHHWETGELLPLLAKSWEANEDATTWTIYLQEGVKFHDGTPFNAAAVKYNLDRLLKIGLARGTYDMIKGIEAADEYTVVITTTPFAPFMHLFTYAPSGMISPTQAEALGWDNYYQHPIGTGPYKFVEHIRGVHSRLVANDDYWGGRPYIDEIIAKPITETASRVAALQAGDIQVAIDVPPIDVGMLQADPGIQILRSEPARTCYVGVNNMWGPLKDKRVRQALNYAVDKDAINESLFLGEAQISTAPFTPLAFGYFEQPVYEYNPAKAKSLLAAAGYAGGFEVTITDSPGRFLMSTEVVEAVASYLEAVGLTVRIEQLEWAKYGTERRKPVGENQLQLFFIAWGCVTLDADHGLKVFRPDQWPPTSDSPLFYTSEGVMDLFDQARSTAVDEERLTAYEQLTALLWDDAPVIWLYIQPNTHAARVEVHGVQVRSDETIWLDGAWIGQ
jgi:ABC-type transport system substrate-binding protein